MIGKQSSNPLLQLLSSLQKQERDDAYLIILQHSESFALRQQQASHNDVDIAVYERANVPLPSEIAKRDLCGKLWLLELSQHCASNLIWVQTGLLNCTRNKKSKATVVHWSGGADPFGWEESNNLNSDEIQLSSLATLTERIRNEASLNSVVIMDSINPILMLYGWERTFQFLQQLHDKLAGVTIIVPVLVECLTVQQHILLEDMAQAVLVLENGMMTMLRQGVCERSKVLRENVQFLLDGTTLRLHVSDTQQSTTPSTVPEAQVKQMDLNVKATVTKVEGPVKLRHEEGDLHSRTKPHIFLQDDDPEFQDLDEEDPDDDLDF
jgi:hypothetical protein